MFPLLAKVVSSVNDMDGVSGLSRLFVARETLADVGCRGMGTCLKKEGGLFGFGAKEAPRPSNQQLVNEGAAALGKYVFFAPWSEDSVSPPLHSARTLQSAPVSQTYHA